MLCLYLLVRIKITKSKFNFYQLAFYFFNYNYNKWYQSYTLHMNTQKNYTLFKMIYEKQDNALILDYLEQGVSQEELEHFQSGYNAFSVAVFHNNQVVVEKLLSLHQKNPSLNFLNILNNDDDNVLSICVKKMQYGMAELLINYEIQHPGTFDLEQVNPMGESFLHYLFFNLNKSTLHTIKLVLEIEHLNVNIQDIHGQTPFIHLMHTFHEDSLKKPIFDYLIHYNKLHDRFDFNLADEDGYSAFLTACTQEDIGGVIKLFLDNHETFNLYARLKNGKNALALAQDTDETFFLKALTIFNI